MFTPFFTTKTQGTGLGLPLTEQILTDHGAGIECASTPGKGTTFTIRFPAEEKP
jgi:signal transduction histidine kinase